MSPSSKSESHIGRPDGEPADALDARPNSGLDSRLDSHPDSRLEVPFNNPFDYSVPAFGDPSDHPSSLLADPFALLAGLRRRAALLFGLPLAVAALSSLFHQPPPIRYETQLTFAVDVPQSALAPGSDEGTSAKVGEALIDDIHRIVQGDVFADAVQARLPESINFSPGDGQSSLSADDRHRVADVTVGRSLPADASPDEIARMQDELELIATSIVDELVENGGDWFSLLGADDVNLSIVDAPDPAHPVPPSLRERVEIPLRIMLAALIGLGLALALHAFDQRLFDASAVESRTRLAVMGRIPHHKHVPGRRETQ